LENPTLLVNLTFALGVAFLGAALAVKLRQSAMIGYILAGIVIGPNTPGFVGDAITVDALANIGVILLLFSIGAQLSVPEMLRTGRVAGIGATIQVLSVIGIAYFVGRLLGWSSLESIFFGAVISNSSTAVLSKVLEDRGESGSLHGTISIAWLTVQDLTTIILVLVLTSLSNGSDRIGIELAKSVGMALIFLVLTIPIGLIVLPRVFEQVAALKSRELMIITTAAFALGTAYVSSLFGLSLALGAFVAGVVVSESDFSHQIAEEIVPLRDIFAGLFFVSVGMLIDPIFVVKHLPIVLVVLAMIVLVKGAISAGLVAVFRFPPRVALLTGVALAQSAEFSFLLARLGLDLDAISLPVYDTLLAGAVASILLSPALHMFANPLASRFDRWFPNAGSAPDAMVPEVAADLRGHAVICGYGRVGHVVGEALRRRGFPIFVIESNPRIVRRLQKEGIMVVLGSADNHVLLEQAGLPRARVLVVAVPDATTTRAVAEYAHAMAPRLNIVARTHSVAERERLEELGVNEAIIGEIELALEMTRHTMHRFGVSTLETQAIIQGSRERTQLNK
jgi:CPA2 family monovalent cation:H+ antiporter-2